MVNFYPPSASLLESCPQFEILHKKLSLAFLDQDGAIKSELAKSSHSIKTNLENEQSALLRNSILLQSMQNLISSEALPQELRMMLAQISLGPELGPQVNADTPEVSTERMPTITESKILKAALRRDLTQQLKVLKTIQNTEDASEVSKTCHQRATNIKSAQENLLGSRLEIISLSSQIISISNTVVKSLRTHLDRNRHGQAERSLCLFSEYLTVIAKGLQSKLTATVDSMQTSLYNTETIAILMRIKDEVESIQRNLEARGEYLEGTFERYKQGGSEYERIVKEYLRTHVSILRCEEEIEDLKVARSGR